MLSAFSVAWSSCQTELGRTSLTIRSIDGRSGVGMWITNTPGQWILENHAISRLLRSLVSSLWNTRANAGLPFPRKALRYFFSFSSYLVSWLTFQMVLPNFRITMIYFVGKRTTCNLSCTVTYIIVFKEWKLHRSPHKHFWLLSH